MIHYLLYKAEETFYKIFSSQHRYRKTAEAMAAADYYELQAVLDAHVRRGYGYAEYHNWQDAIREFENALGIHPNHEEAVFGLAYAHYNCWLDYGKTKDKYRAAGLARRCIELDASNHQAMQLLSQIYKGAALEEAMKKNSWHTGILATLVAAMLASGGYLSYIYLAQQLASEPFQIEQTMPYTANTASLAFDTQAFQNTSTNKIIPTNLSIWEEKGVHLPVEWIDNPKFEGLKLEVEQSRFKDFNGSYSYNLLADLYVASGNISKLKLKIELLDSQGHTITQDYIQAIENYDPIARKGESIPFRYLEYQEQFAEDIALVRIKVEQVEYQQELNEIQTLPVSLEWENMNEFEPAVLLSQRSSNLQATDQNGAFHHFEWEIQNATKESQIRLLQAQINWIGKNGAVLDTRTTYLINSSEPSLKANQIRSIGRAYRLSHVKAEDISHYTVIIKSIEK